MYLGPSLTTQPPAVIVHLALAGSAVLIGSVALLNSKGSTYHRFLGRAWVALMLGAALSSLFIHDFRLPNVLGYTAIHTLTLLVFIGVGVGIWHVRRKNIAMHQRAMRFTYRAALVAGAFALLPQRYLGGLLWQYTLGLY